MARALNNAGISGEKAQTFPKQKKADKGLVSNGLTPPRP